MFERSRNAVHGSSMKLIVLRCDKVCVSCSPRFRTERNATDRYVMLIKNWSCNPDGLVSATQPALDRRFLLILAALLKDPA